MPPPRILLVRFGSIGDVLLTSPLVRALRERHPDAHIAYLTKSVHVPLVSASPRLDRVLALEPGESIASVAGRVRAEGYTHRLDLHGNLRSHALRVLLPGRWSGYPKRRIARTILIRSKRDVYRDRRPVAERYFDAARGLDVRPDGRPPEMFIGEAAAARADALLGAARAAAPLAAPQEPARPLVALAPGAAHATKRWPPERWHALAGTLAAQGHDLVIIGGAAEQPVADVIAAELPRRAVSLAGRTGLQETGAVIRRAALLVSGDTGVMHMATAVGTPVVALFGPTVRQFGFFPYAAPARVLELPLGCRPCTAMGGPACPLGHHLCLRGIPSGSVADTVMEVLR